MSRKLIFFFSMLSVLSYFGVIFMIISPLSGIGTTFYTNNYMQSYPLRRAPSMQVRWCKELRWRSPPARHPVALVSFPGSGNTWLRYLLQQLTGIVTGSIYMDYGLRQNGFPAENISDGSVLVVKTHENPPLEPDRFKAAILLIRNPRDAILADYNWLHKGHIGTAPKSAFRKRSHEHRNTDWANYVASQLKAWQALHRAWLARFSGPIHIVFYEVLVQDTRTTLQAIMNFLNHTVTEAWQALHRAWLARFSGPIHIVFYEVLVQDTRTMLQAIMNFLNHTVTEEDMNCTMANKEGIYRRPKKYSNFDPFTKNMYEELKRVRNRVLKMVVKYQKEHNETELLHS